VASYKDSKKKAPSWDLVSDKTIPNPVEEKEILNSIRIKKMENIL
jgi:hypothetical protein